MGGHIGKIIDPQLIWPIGSKLPFHQIIGPFQFWTTHCGALVFTTPNPLHAVFVHQSRIVQQAMNADPLALIEYWAVDPDYDGQVFRSVWQDYRGNTANDADALRVVTQAQLTLPLKTGPRKVCVRVVDVFGFEAEVISTVE